MNKDFFNFWYSSININKNNSKSIKNFNLNFGPQHPAAHGVLRIILQMKSELIENSDIHIGLLHRGSEKLLEEKTYLLGLPYFDRMDYVSVLMQEHAYCLAIENLLNTTNYQNEYTQIRVIFDELTRLLNHLMGITTHSLDVGCMASVFWGFEEREKIMEFYERVSGARMHAAFYRPNDLSLNYITKDLIKDILLFLRNFLKYLAIFENKLNMSSIWKNRLVNIGILLKKFAYKWGVTGVLARSAGIKRDLRLSFFETYAAYYFLNIRSFTGYTGDCYDRYLIRIREMNESVHIITQVINKINLSYSNEKKNINSFSTNFLNYIENITTFIIKPLKKINLNSWYINMEELINHFKYFTEGLRVPQGVSYKSIESGKGEFGVFLVSDGSSKPYRVKIKPASYYNLQILTNLVQNHFFSDLVTLIGSQDIVLGEVDR